MLRNWYEVSVGMAEGLSSSFVSWVDKLKEKEDLVLD